MQEYRLDKDLGHFHVFSDVFLVQSFVYSFDSGFILSTILLKELAGLKLRKKERKCPKIFLFFFNLFT